ncbi:MAG: transposase, partial [Bacteroidota bacterium]
KKRPCEIEAVFGILKQNRNFRRLSLRGLEKVEIEVGLHAVAHNFRKLAAKMTQKKGKDPLFPFQEPKRVLHNTNQLLKVA